jgi:hypothetical protein
VHRSIDAVTTMKIGFVDSNWRPPSEGKVVKGTALGNDDLLPPPKPRCAANFSYHASDGLPTCSRRFLLPCNVAHFCA